MTGELLVVHGAQSSNRSPLVRSFCGVGQVEEMAKTVDVAEKHPARFGLTQAEISSRRKWIMQTTREVGGIPCLARLRGASCCHRCCWLAVAHSWTAADCT